MIKTAAVLAAVGHLGVVILSLVVEGITNITVQLPPSYAGPIFTQLLAVNPLTVLGEMVVRAAQPTLELPRPTRRVGAVLFAVATPRTEVAEGGALVALLPTSEGIPGIVPVGLAVRTVLHQVLRLPALLAPPALSWSLGLHCAGAAWK